MIDAYYLNNIKKAILKFFVSILNGTENERVIDFEFIGESKRSPLFLNVNALIDSSFISEGADFVLTGTDEFPH